MGVLVVEMRFAACHGAAAIRAGVLDKQRALHGPVGEELRDDDAFLFWRELAVGAALSECGERHDRSRAIHLLRIFPPSLQQLAQARWLQFVSVKRLDQRVSPERGWIVVDKHVHERRDRPLKVFEGSLLIAIQLINRIVGFP